jgi:hypothetical protein
MLFSIIFAAASLVLLARVILGPFHLGISVNSPLNAEGVVALSFLLALLLRARQRQESAATTLVRPAILGACALLVAIAFLPGVTAPLLHDSYIHVWLAATEPWTTMLRNIFIRYSAASGPFFRPLGFITYWIDYRWAGFNPTLWHAWNLALHLVNCALVWLLARRLSLTPLPATIAALLFALHGTRPEVVSWAAARFDLLATFFSLVTLLAVDRFASLWIVAACSMLALLSKEAAFALPLLILLWIPFKPESDRRRILQAAAVSAVVCALFLGYRTWFLGGIGGYTTAAGEPSIFQFSVVRSAKALLFRQWAILFFPINWSKPPGPVLKIASAAMILAAAGFLRWSNGSRRRLLLSLAFVILAVLPAQHLLLIGADLSGARILYLPSVGLALFWGFAVEGCAHRIARLALPAGLLLFQTAALEHNLGIWRDVAFRSQQICRNFGAEIARDPRPVSVRNLPATMDGVFFLKNGFPQCVAINSRQSADRIYTGEAPTDARAFVWAEETQTLQNSLR